MIKSVVCLSSGLDSTVNLFLAHQQTKVVATVTFDYGQKASQREIEKAQALSMMLNIPHQVIATPWLKNFGKSSLTSDEQQVPVSHHVSIDDYNVSSQTAKAVWVPNRNGIFLNIAAGLAESLSADVVIPGFNLEEATTFPDNSEDFIKTLDAAFSYSTANQVKVACYTVKLSKNEIVKKGIELKVPFEKTWPCYFAEEKWCGICESCQRAKRAFKANNLNLNDLFKG
jgi:7-cyano-7-deazaguanine synthase